MSAPLSHNAGISRPEILLVLSVFLALASIILPALLEIQKRNRSAQTYSELRVLVSAANRFNREYRLWPVANPPPKGDAHFGARDANMVVMNILRGLDQTGNEQHRANPSQIDFIEEVSEGASPLRFNARGEVIDPWGRPYEMVFDSNYDSICTVENNVYGPVIGTGVIIWSSGPDRKSETIDDLRSWKP
jgi:type II secretory pathway pseudopilin PulG